MSIKRFNGAGIYSPKSIKVWDQYTTLNDFQSIATVIVPSGGQSSITFSNIPQNYTHLQLRGVFRSDLSSSGNNIGLYMRFNNDSTSGNYYWHELYGNGSSAGSYSQSDASIFIDGHGPRAGDPANVFGVAVIDVLDYTNTSKSKFVKALNGDDLNGSGWVALNSGGWFYNVSSVYPAINQISFYVESSNFAQYSQFALYGTKVAS